MGKVSLERRFRTEVRPDPWTKKFIKHLFERTFACKYEHMNSYNRVTLVGNLTRQPELRKTKTGASVTDLGLALNRVWNGENGQRQEETTYVDVTVWGRAAENAAQYLQKGRCILVEGRLQMESWQDKQTGQERQRLKVVADSLQFLGSANDSGDPERDPDRPGGRGEREEDVESPRPSGRDGSRDPQRSGTRGEEKRDRRYNAA